MSVRLEPTVAREAGIEAQHGEHLQGTKKLNEIHAFAIANRGSSR